MKLFNLFLLWCSVLSTHVLANNDAAPYELLHYYYVYKMEWDAGVEKTIAPGCATEYKKMCFFDQFASFLIEDRWNKVYLPTKADRTKTPGVGAAKRLSIKMPTSARYDLEKLLPSIKANAKDFPRVFETVLHSANKAIKTGKVKNDDVKQAVEWAQEVKDMRYEDVFEVEIKVLRDLLGDEAYGRYVVTGGGSSFDWDATLEGIDDDVDAKKLSDKDAKRLKEIIDNFPKTFNDRIATGHISDINHINIMRALETSITSLTGVIEESSSESDDASPESVPDDTCSNIEFAFDSE
ncbi:uncharacterized protein BO88DRAFT_465895 [Aspergillus vadensis CBS 113365]|uniref:Uncharacterized protein n=1 Tax=Aspergillus vadensis (strain CBS 113365 / IMI 142717 / IBT 24658) TaxID=1448311 RepID=A0A319BA88_ASPVC|nr:hypothetical protein BO88DRAFT_465895 [Aspergillus vadensis CBS 113365]PYH67400.1 hypothetical protein BO88DRAFT_465895 [Aspergillus vadensis CBS 113365]